MLRALFLPYGRLESVKVVPGKGFGFVNYERYEDAMRAVKQLNGFRDVDATWQTGEMSIVLLSEL